MFWPGLMERVLQKIERAGADFVVPTPHWHLRPTKDNLNTQHWYLGFLTAKELGSRDILKQQLWRGWRPADNKV